MATLNHEVTYSTSSAIIFNTTNPINNITYNSTTGTFTLVNAGQYLINWVASIKNEGPSSVLSLGLYQVTPGATYLAYSNTGNTISNNASTIIAGTAIVTATANSTYQLRNVSGQNISTVTNGNIAATITITKIN
jgi:hypothetical protein